PIIAMTGNARRDGRERCLEAGMDDCLVKPVSSDEVLELLHALTANKAAPPAELNHDALLERVEGDVRLARDLATLFCSEIPRYREQFAAALSAGDAQRVHKIAHTLKGAVANFGARRAQELTAGLEDQGRTGDLEGAEATLAHMEEELRRLQESLKAFVHSNV